MKNPEFERSFTLLKGTISKLRKSRCHHDFVSENQHRQIQTTAIVATAMGMGSAGIGLIGMAENSAEEADWIEFDLEGKSIQGWLWMMPMHNGDSVEVVAETLDGNRHIAYAIKRDMDDLLAVYPHATAGRKAHYRRAIKAWIWWSVSAYIFLTLFFATDGGIKILFDSKMQFILLTSSFVTSVFCAFVAFRVSRKFSAFVRLAEKIFETFEWSNPKDIDLRKASRENRHGDKSPEFGNFYFRYKSIRQPFAGFFDNEKDANSQEAILPSLPKDLTK